MEITIIGLVVLTVGLVEVIKAVNELRKHGKNLIIKGGY